MMILKTDSVHKQSIQSSELFQQHYKEARRVGIINEKPAANMRRLHSKKKVRGILTLEEVTKLFRYRREDRRCKLASQLAACHGLRAGEIGAICREDIDEENNIIYIRHSWERQLRNLKSTKNGHERCIHSSPELIKILVQLYNENPFDNRFIFWDSEKSDEPINLDNFLDQLRISLGAIGISNEEQKTGL